MNGAIVTLCGMSSRTFVTQIDNLTLCSSHLTRMDGTAWLLTARLVMSDAEKIHTLSYVDIMLCQWLLIPEWTPAHQLNGRSYNAFRGDSDGGKTKQQNATTAMELMVLPFDWAVYCHTPNLFIIRRQDQPGLSNWKKNFEREIVMRTVTVIWMISINFINSIDVTRFIDVFPIRATVLD